MLNEQIQNHYHKPNLYQAILERLKNQGTDLTQVTRKDISGVDEFHVRGAAVSKELANTIDLKGKKVLDVGCGIGGPCRMLAEEFECQCVGIDISEEFIKTAKKLSELVGLSIQTTFLQADANNLPFEKGTFDVVWTQHVQMNIPNKVSFYSEIARVLKPGGFFLYYDIFQNENGVLTFPVPWASTPSLSFLERPEVMDQILLKAKFLKTQSTDQTKAGIDFFENLMPKLKAQAPNKPRLDLLMGDSIKIKLSNLLKGLKNGNLMLQSGVYKKHSI